MKHTVPPRKLEGTGEEPAQTHSFLGCDAHRKYSVVVAMDEQGRTTEVFDLQGALPYKR